MTSTFDAATTNRRDSSAPPFASSPVADLTVDFYLSAAAEQKLHAEVDRLQQHSIVIYAVGGRPNRAELRHLLQARLQGELAPIIDIQFLGKGCYHIEFNSGNMVDKLLLMGSVKIKGIWMQFLKWYAGFDLDDLRDTISRRFVFSIMFPALPNEWRPVINEIAATIGHLIDDDVEIERFNSKNQNTPIVRLLGHSNMVFPASIRLPPLSGGKARVQKIIYAGLPNQCFKCRQIGHMAKDCIWQNAPNVNSMEKVKEKGAIGVVDEWTTVRKGKGILAENVNHSNKWVPIRNRFGSIENRTPTLPMDDVLVEEVDGASITKHKIDMDQIIDRDLSTSSINTGGNNLLHSLVDETHTKDNQTLANNHEDLGMKGDENLSLVVYAEKEDHTTRQEHSNGEKSGEHVNLLQIVTTEICHSSREDTHNYNGRITRSRAKYLESEFNSNHHHNQETNATVVHSTLNKVMDRNSMINRFMHHAKKHGTISYSNKMPLRGLKISNKACKFKKSTLDGRTKVSKQLLLSYE